MWVWSVTLTLDMKWILRQWAFGCKLKDYGEEVTLILLDTEGIDAANASDQGDSQIFTLSVLLSSLLIYNSMTVPRREDLNQMQYPYLSVCSTLYSLLACRIH